MFYVEHSEAREALVHGTFTQPWIAGLTEFRNSSNDKGDEYQMTCLEVFARRVVGELGYAALLVASVIEGVVSLLLNCMVVLLCLPFVCCCFQFIGELATDTCKGVINDLDTSLRCLVGLVKNIWRDHMSYRDLAVYEIQAPSDEDV